jgi:UDP-N-acetylglucosamine 1-carboxyvinyltransferase
MRHIVIEGPCRLSGTVCVQGAKNSAMKHVLSPLLTSGKFLLKNIPNIGSTKKLLDIVQIQGATVTWIDAHTVSVDTADVIQSHPIPADLFYYTSGAIHAIPQLVSRFGNCIIETEAGRTDTGGDQIGSRKLSLIIESFKRCGIGMRETGEYIEFYLESDTPFDYEVPVQSFSASVNSVLCALFKKGTSTIRKYTGEAEFYDILNFWKQMGADIKITPEALYVTGGKQLNGIEYSNMFDRQDFATWVSIALSTGSEITIGNVDYSAMRLESMEPTLLALGVQADLHSSVCKLNYKPADLNPVQIKAGMYPMFQTEWQVLFSPLFAQLRGTSRISEYVFTNRMRHWEELAKMGATYEFIPDPECPEENGNPRAVTVHGPVKLHAATVTAADLRSGACLVTAGLAAKGTTIITNIEHIERGYEDFVERLVSLGARIKISQ